MREILVLFLRKITEILPCSSDLSPSQQSSSSGDLLPEMMESGTPPPAVPPYEAGDPEVSSRRVCPSQQSSSSGDLLPEMMESGTPPPAVPPYEAGDPEVSSRRVSPSPAGPEGSAPTGVRSEELKDLLGERLSPKITVR